MGLIDSYELVSVFTDIQRMDSLGNWHNQYLCYIDVNNNVRVSQSLDDGQTWIPIGSGYVTYEGGGSVTVGPNSGCTWNPSSISLGDALPGGMVTVWDGAAVVDYQYYVSEDVWIPVVTGGISSGTVSRSFALDFNTWYVEAQQLSGQAYIYAAITSTYPTTTFAGINYIPRTWGAASAADGNSQAFRRCIQRLGPAGTGYGVFTTSFDPSLGELGEAPGTVRVTYIPPDPPLHLHGQTIVNVDFLNTGATWIGLGDSNAHYMGFVSADNFFGGVSTGHHSFTENDINYSNRAVFEQQYFVGSTNLAEFGTPQVADRGLIPPHQVALTGFVQGTPVCFFIDSNNLYGSTVSGTSSNLPDSSGFVTSFGRAKIYGTSSAPTMGWMNNQQDSTLTVTLLVGNQFYSFHDPTPFDQQLPTNVFKLSEITDSEIYVPKKAALPASQLALGLIRSDSTFSSYNISELRSAIAQPGSIDNPNGSSGCSPILRMLLKMSGLQFSIDRELANDGQTYGHQGGNALDISASDQQGFEDLAAWADAFASLFSSAVWVNPDSTQASLYIWDGAVADPSVFPTGFETGLTTRMHLSSSFGRLSKGFSDPFVLAAMGVGPGQVSGTTITAQFDLGQFGDRYVYVNPDHLLSATRKPGTRVRDDENFHRVDFW